MTALMTMEHASGDGTGPDVANDSRRWWILAVLGIAQLMVILDSTIVNIALPTAQHDLGFSNVDRQRVLPCLRQFAPPRRSHRGQIRSQAGPHHRTGRLRWGFSHRWGLGQF